MGGSPLPRLSTQNPEVRSALRLTATTFLLPMIEPNWEPPHQRLFSGNVYRQSPARKLLVKERVEEHQHSADLILVLCGI